MKLLNPLYLALVATFFQHSFAMMAKLSLPIIAAVAFPALGVAAENVGLLSGFYAACQAVLVMFSGSLIRRYGGLRISQIGLFIILIGMAAAASGTIWVFAVTTVLVSFGVSVSAPASTHILARYAPPRHAPLIFSTKQTAVPIGQIAAGIVVPALVVLHGWQGAFIGIGLLCACFAILVEPARRELDRDRDPSHPLSPRSIKEDVRCCLGHPGLRLLVLTECAFMGAWMVYTTYFVLFFIDRLEYSLAGAGGMLATATLIGLPARMIFGYVASRWLSPFTMLAILGFTTTAALVLTGLNSAAWPAWALLSVAVLVNAGATGWQGVALSELARLAPPGRAGAITGATIGLGAISQVVLPPLFAVILFMTDSYRLAFAVVAVPVSVVGVMCLAVDRRGAATPASAGAGTGKGAAQ